MVRYLYLRPSGCAPIHGPALRYNIRHCSYNFYSTHTEHKNKVYLKILVPIFINRSTQANINYELTKNGTIPSMGHIESAL